MTDLTMEPPRAVPRAPAWVGQVSMPRLGENWAAYVGVVAGLAVSVWANVEHALLSSERRGAVVLSAFIPLSLFLALEVLMRGKRWKNAKGALWFARAATVVVALVAAFISYHHLRGLALLYGESVVSASLLPLAVDALMAVCAASLMAATADRRPGRKKQTSVAVTVTNANGSAEALASRPVTARRQRATVGGGVSSKELGRLRRQRAVELRAEGAEAATAKRQLMDEGASEASARRIVDEVWGVAA